MKCPSCANDMTVVRVHDVEVDRCHTCGGVLLDKGESEVIDALKLGEVIEASTPDPKVGKDGGAYCHACERDMIALVGAGEVEYDWCEGCERIFFDHGELAQFGAFKDD
ncbi:MAG: zf-TFIIB domain-containing protein [Kofleriaceae bacterium]